MSFNLLLLWKSWVVVDVNNGGDLFLQFFSLNFLAKKLFPNNNYSKDKLFREYYLFQTKIIRLYHNIKREYKI
jgi:hypothetical protein